MQHTQEELFKLIGGLTGYGPESTTVHVTYNPARIYNGFGESEGLNYNDWGYAVSVKLCMMEDVRVDASDKDLTEALWKLAQAIPAKFQDMHNKRRDRAAEVSKKLEEYLTKKQPEMPKTNSSYRD